MSIPLKSLPLPAFHRFSTLRHHLLLGFIAAASRGEDGVVRMFPISTKDLSDYANLRKTRLAYIIGELEKTGLIERGKRKSPSFAINPGNYDTFAGKPPFMRVSNSFFIEIYKRGDLNKRQKALSLIVQSGELGESPTYKDVLSENWLNLSSRAYLKKIFVQDLDIAKNAVAKTSSIGSFSGSNSSLSGTNVSFSGSNGSDLGSNSSLSGTNGSLLGIKSKDNSSLLVSHSPQSPKSEPITTEKCTSKIVKSLNNRPNCLTIIKKTAPSDEESKLDDLAHICNSTLQTKFSALFKKDLSSREITECLMSVRDLIEEGFTALLVEEIMIDAWQRYFERNQVPAFTARAAKKGFIDYRNRVIKKLSSRGYSGSQIREYLQMVTEKVTMGEEISPRYGRTLPKRPLTASRDIVSSKTTNNTDTPQATPQELQQAMDFFSRDPDDLHKVNNIKENGSASLWFLLFLHERDTAKQP